MAKLNIAIDLSLRCTAIVALNEEGELVDQKIVTTTAKEYNDEALLLYNNESIMEFITEAGQERDEVKAIAIERLSFNSASADRDLIDANQWILRTSIYGTFPSLKVQLVSVKEWRSRVISDVEDRLINDSAPVIRAKKGIKLSKDETKVNNRNKAIRKKATKELTVEKLPHNVKIVFDKYIKDAKLKDVALYDLADAYFICKYLMGSEKK